MRRCALVTGVGGQVGHELRGAFAARGWEVAGVGHGQLDISDREGVRALLHTVRPSVVVNPAAWTDVDGCESDPDRAWAVNALAVRHLVEACAEVGAHLTHLSTDYVFDGTKPEPYVEWDLPNPQSVYGRSKLGGELELAAAGTSATLVRTAWVCGVAGPNMVRTVLRLADGRAADPARTLAFVDDQRGCPTMAADLAAKVVELTADRRPGCFHVTNQGATSWFGFVQHLLALLGSDPDRVRPIATAELDPPRPAPRPANSVLDNAALRASGLAPLPPWQDSLPGLVESLRTEPMGERSVPVPH